MTSTTTLIEDFAHLVLDHNGKHTEFNQCAAFETASQGSMIFIQHDEQLNPNASVVVTTADVRSLIDDDFSGFIVVVDDVRYAQALIKQAYDDYETQTLEWDCLHPSAVIHNTATMGLDCYVGPNAVIGKDVVLGDNVVVRSNSVIEAGSRIGDNTIINSNVTICYNSKIGDNVIVQSGVVIGNEGYGFAQAKDKSHHRIPHTGYVEIKDDVSIGTNSCIDRGTYGATVIGRGVKIDNLCHIAHNVEIGEDSLIIAQTGIAGSSKIGKRVITTGQSGVLDHKTVADDVVLVHRTAVLEDISSAGVWGGNPAKPFKEHIRRNNIGKFLERRIVKIEAKLKQLHDKLSD